jgi:hypothetical protein
MFSRHSGAGEGFLSVFSVTDPPQGHADGGGGVHHKMEYRNTDFTSYLNTVIFHGSGANFLFMPFHHNYIMKVTRLRASPRDGGA